MQSLQKVFYFFSFKFCFVGHSGFKLVLICITVILRGYNMTVLDIS